MALELTLSLQSPVISTLDAPKVQVRMNNRDGSSRQVPSLGDMSGSIAIEVLHNSRLVRHFSGLTHQMMMLGGRVADVPELEPLAAGSQRTWDYDLASYHYTLAAGHYQLRAVYTDPVTAEQLYSEPQRLEVRVLEVKDLLGQRDNPVLDGVALLMHVAHLGGPAYVLRQHNTGKPLAAWYSELIQLDHCSNDVFLARPNFFTTDSFDPFFRRWLIWQESDNVYAQAWHWGKRSETLYSAVLPKKRLLRSAIITEDDSLWLFSLSENGDFVAMEWIDGRLKQRFSLNVPSPESADIAIQGDCDYIHVAIPVKGVYYLRLGYDGKVYNRNLVMRSSQPVYNVAFDPVGKLLKAAFLNEASQELTLAAIRPETSQRSRSVFKLDALSGNFVELGWDYNPETSRFHLLVSDAGGTLFYYQHNAPAKFIHQGKGPFFPLVIAQSQTFLGYYRPQTGYRIGSYSLSRDTFVDPHSEL